MSPGVAYSRLFPLKKCKNRGRIRVDSCSFVVETLPVPRSLFRIPCSIHLHLLASSCTNLQLKFLQKFETCSQHQNRTKPDEIPPSPRDGPLIINDFRRPSGRARPVLVVDICSRQDSRSRPGRPAGARSQAVACKSGRGLPQSKMLARYSDFRGFCMSEELTEW